MYKHGVRFIAARAFTAIWRTLRNMESLIDAQPSHFPHLTRSRALSAIYLTAKEQVSSAVNDGSLSRFAQ